MNKEQVLRFMIFIGGVVFLFPSFYRDQYRVVEPEHYRLWQRTYDRVVIARVAMSQQNGIFSSAGLLGLAEAEDGWNFDPNRQFEIYENGEPVTGYRVYRSHPGFQGFLFSFIDSVTNLSRSHNVELFRGFVAAISAVVISLLATIIAVQLGWLSGVFVLVFSSTSEWMILPGGNLYWNLWAFFLPFLTAIFVIEDSRVKKRFDAGKIYFAIYTTVLIKILFTGFEMITSVLVMTTVPFVYNAVLYKWGGVVIKRLLHLGFALILSTISGLFVLTIQIAWNDGNIESPYNYIIKTLDRRAFGDPNDRQGISYDESLQASDLSVIETYLKINAFNTQAPERVWELNYREMIFVLIASTIFFLSKRSAQIRNGEYRKGVAFLITTWYSMFAPLSWYIVFTATSYIHTFLFPMAWQMPFTLLGFALCGYVIQDFFKSTTTSSPSPSSLTD